jgi:hypothetical protein
MTPERWRRVKEVFGEALLAEPGARSTLLRAHAATITSSELRSMAARRPCRSRRVHANILRPFLNDAGGINGGVAEDEYGRVGPIALHAGGTGEVYEATDTRTGRGVAIKVLTDEAVDAARRLTREARHAAELAHPNICEIHEVVNDEEGAFIAMELLDGRVLADAVPSGGCEAAQATDLALQLAAAIAHAHAHAIVHRDLKCANLMLLDDGRLKVLDFGLARRLPESIESAVSAASMTDAGAIAGTISYLAPELLRGEQADTRSDVWACGIVLHELLTGEQPFEGRTPFELTSTVLREPPRPLPPSVPAGLRTIRDNCLAKDPAHRYQTGGEWLAALEAYTSGKRVKPHVRPVRRLRWLWAAAAAVVTLLATAVAFVERHGAGSMVSRVGSVLPLQGDRAGREPSHFLTGDRSIDRAARHDRLDPECCSNVDSAVRSKRFIGQASPGSQRRHGGSRDGRNPARTRSAGAGGCRHRHRSRDQRIYDVGHEVRRSRTAVRGMAEGMGIELPSPRAACSRRARRRSGRLRTTWGRFYWNKRTDGSLEQAAAFYHAAIDRSDLRACSRSWPTVTTSWGR